MKIELCFHPILIKLELCFHPIRIKLETISGITIIFHMENQFENFLMNIVLLFNFINIGSQLSNIVQYINLLLFMLHCITFTLIQMGQIYQFRYQSSHGYKSGSSFNCSVFHLVISVFQSVNKQEILNDIVSVKDAIFPIHIKKNTNLKSI